MGHLVLYVFMCTFGVFVVFMGLMITLASVVRICQAMTLVCSSVKKFPSLPSGPKTVEDTSCVVIADGEEHGHDGYMEGTTADPGELGPSPGRLGDLAESVRQW